MSKPSRRDLLAHCLDDDARADLVAFAVDRGVAPERAPSVADAAAVRAFRRGIPRDRSMVQTLLRLEVRRQAAAEASRGEVGGATPGSPAPLTRRVLSRRIRRARLCHLGLLGGAAVTACAVTVGAALAITQVDRTPSTTSAPVVPAEPPAVVDEPTTPATPQVLGPVSDVAGLPAAEPLLEGMIEGAGPGWSLVQLEVEGVEETTFLYLKDPDGVLYEIPTPLAERTWWRDGLIVEWLPGTRLVLVQWWRQEEFAVMDVLTGERLLTVPNALEGHAHAGRSVTFVGDGTTDLLAWWAWQDEGGADAQGSRMVRLALDGSERATAERELPTNRWYFEAIISPDGTRAVFDDPGASSIVATADLGEVGSVPSPVAADRGWCAPERWLGDEALLLDCYRSDGGDRELWIADVGSGETTRLGNGDGTAWAVGDGLVLVRLEEYSEGREYLGTLSFYACGWDGACSDEPLAEVSDWPTAGVADGLLHAFDAPYEISEYGGTYSVTDLATGEVRSVLELGPEAAARRVVPWGRSGIWFSFQ